MTDRLGWWLGAFITGVVGGILPGGIVLVAILYKLDAIREFQTLITGVLAIFASLIALLGVIINSYMYSEATRKDRERQIEFEKTRIAEQEKRQSVAFSHSLLMCMRAIALDIESHIEVVTKANKQYDVQTAVNMLCSPMWFEKLPRTYASNWRDLSLIEPEIAANVQFLAAMLEDLERIRVKLSRATHNDDALEDALQLFGTCLSTANETKDMLDLYLSKLS